MKNKYQVVLAGALFALPLAAFAGETPTVAKTEQTHASNMSIMLEGAKTENTAQIVKLAKDAGATKASFNAKTSTLTVAGMNFSKQNFESSLSSSLPGVSVKN